MSYRIAKFIYTSKQNIRKFRHDILRLRQQGITIITDLKLSTMSYFILAYDKDAHNKVRSIISAFLDGHLNAYRYQSQPFPALCEHCMRKKPSRNCLEGLWLGSALTTCTKFKSMEQEVIDRLAKTPLKILKKKFPELEVDYDDYGSYIAKKLIFKISGSICFDIADPDMLDKVERYGENL